MPASPSSLFAVPLAAEAQPVGKVVRIGYLSNGFAATPATPVRPLEALRQRLRELGYVEGRNVTIEYRFAEGNNERLPALAAELVRLNPDIIVTWSSPAAVAAKKATGTIPIVMETSLDSVREGIVASLARPGGNVTGMTLVSDPDLIGKRLQLLQEVLPTVSRLAIVLPGRRPISRAGEVWLKDAEAAAKALGLTIPQSVLIRADEVVQ